MLRLLQKGKILGNFFFNRAFAYRKLSSQFRRATYRQVTCPMHEKDKAKHVLDEAKEEKSRHVQLMKQPDLGLYTSENYMQL